ncbi:MAG: GntR family transcriptional regulator, partial [Hyphomicrobiaceae bacterium]
MCRDRDALVIMMPCNMAIAADAKLVSRIRPGWRYGARYTAHTWRLSLRWLMASEAVLRSKDDLIERQRAIAPRAKLNDMVPLQRTTLHEQVVNRIRDLIIDGTLLSGSRIVEAELGAQLGVSRTPLREAFKTLAGEGLIDLQPTRGAFIHKSTADEAQQMLEVLTGLEAFAGRLACQRASDAEIGELRRKQDRMATFFANHRRMDYYKINIEI